MNEITCNTCAHCLIALKDPEIGCLGIPKNSLKIFQCEISKQEVKPSDSCSGWSPDPLF